MIENPFHLALSTTHAPFAQANGPALRYAPDIIPFAAIAAPTIAAMEAFRDLLAPGETIWTTGNTFPEIPGLTHTLELPGLQMHYTGASITQPIGEHNITKLTQQDVPEMLELKAVAFPGFFGPRAIELGDFFGIRRDGQLIAMAGERLCTPTHREISAVCTHPAHTGHGYAAALMEAVRQAQLARGTKSILHVVASNTRAIALYHRLGFETSGDILFQRFHRT
jgi:predicted GNAT family acetyltransferase